MSPESIDDPRRETLLFCEGLIKGLIGRIVAECHQRRKRYIESLPLDQAMDKLRTKCPWSLSVTEQSLLLYTPDWWNDFEDRLQEENIGVETDGSGNIVLTFRFEQTMRKTEVREGVLKVIDPSWDTTPKKDDRRILWK